MQWQPTINYDLIGFSEHYSTFLTFDVNYLQWKSITKTHDNNLITEQDLVHQFSSDCFLLMLSEIEKLHKKLEENYNETV